MDTTFIWICGAILLDGVAGLSGGVLPTPFIHRHMGTLLAFAAGTLVAAAFSHLLPEALQSSVPPHEILFFTLIGFTSFYVIESFLGSHAAGQSGHKHSTIGPMILVGDALHNATDGIAIAAAFLADTRTGIATTLAVIVHELPQEIGDYSILITHGYSRAKALGALFVVQCAAFVGAFGVLLAASMMVHAAPFLMALSAGGFLYIAAADLLPEVQRINRCGEHGGERSEMEDHEGHAHQGRWQHYRGPIIRLAAFSAGLVILKLVSILVGG